MPTAPSPGAIIHVLNHLGDMLPSGGSKRAFLVPDGDPYSTDCELFYDASMLTAGDNDMVFCAETFRDAAKLMNEHAKLKNMTFDEAIIVDHGYDNAVGQSWLGDYVKEQDVGWTYIKDCITHNTGFLPLIGVRQDVLLTEIVFLLENQ